MGWGEVLCNLNQNYCKLKQKEEGQRSIDMDRKVLDVKYVDKARGWEGTQILNTTVERPASSVIPNLQAITGENENLTRKCNLGFIETWWDENHSWNVELRYYSFKRNRLRKKKVLWLSNLNMHLPVK